MESKPEQDLSSPTEIVTQHPTGLHPKMGRATESAKTPGHLWGGVGWDVPPQTG